MVGALGAVSRPQDLLSCLADRYGAVQSAVTVTQAQLRVFDAWPLQPPAHERFAVNVWQVLSRILTSIVPSPLSCTYDVVPFGCAVRYALRVDPSIDHVTVQPVWPVADADNVRTPSQAVPVTETDGEIAFTVTVTFPDVREQPFASVTVT
jgi:hypothetical protein